MGKDNETESMKVGIIPDFFHDIIAYIIPGYTSLVLFTCNLYIIGLLKPSFTKDIDIKGFSLSVLGAYVIGRFYEQLGFMTIHRRKFPFIRCCKKFPKVCKSNKIPSPKWSLIFDSNDEHYTKPFKDNVAKKIMEWIENQDGASLLSTCKEEKKDDFFNLIQFYLRERFPSVALYEKKQNATIVMSRSLAIIFTCNILIYFLLLLIPVLQGAEVTFSLIAVYWIVANLLFSGIFYIRFQQDKVYHAMYIFETFIAMKKLLKTREDNCGQAKGETDDIQPLHSEDRP
jgi:hypothetical protein